MRLDFGADLRGAVTVSALLADATLVIDSRVAAQSSAAQIGASTRLARKAGLTVLNRLRIGRKPFGRQPFGG